AELGDGLAAVRQQPLLEFGIGPGLGDDARAILGDPLLLNGVLEVLDELERLHAALFEGGLDGVDALLHGGGVLLDRAVVGHASLPGWSPQYNLPGGRRAAREATPKRSFSHERHCRNPRP